jgi:hypothetical protein
MSPLPTFTLPSAYLCFHVQGAEFVAYNMVSILQCMFARLSYAGHRGGRKLWVLTCWLQCTIWITCSISSISCWIRCAADDTLGNMPFSHNYQQNSTKQTMMWDSSMWKSMTVFFNYSIHKSHIKSTHLCILLLREHKQGLGLKTSSIKTEGVLNLFMFLWVFQHPTVPGKDIEKLVCTSDFWPFFPHGVTSSSDITNQKTENVHDMFTYIQQHSKSLIQHTCTTWLPFMLARALLWAAFHQNMYMCTEKHDVPTTPWGGIAQSV